VKESDIRPEDLFQHFLHLCQRDAEELFGREPRRGIACPACGESRSEHAFDKWGFSYRACSDCSTLFLSPRPEPEQFGRFYRQSESARYWAQTVFPAVAEARREQLFRPKARQIAELCQRAGLEVRCLADVGAGQGMFLESWRELSPSCRCVAVEPHPHQAEVCRSKGFDVVECFIEEVEQLSDQADLAVALEVIEHAVSPLDFCRCVGGLVRPGGAVLFTGLGADGFDIQMLWEKSRSVSPPQHINFLSLQGAVHLMARAGFVDIEAFTPGKLDVDIVRKAVAADPSLLEGSRFLRTLFGRSTPAVLERFQQFLAESGLSSHLWLWARKPS
jgi:SAM-dependent methyltransferase